MTAQLPLTPPHPTCADFWPGDTSGHCYGNGDPTCLSCHELARETESGHHRPMRLGWLTSVARLADGRYVLRCKCGDYLTRTPSQVANAKATGSRSKCRRCRLVVLRIQKLAEHKRRRELAAYCRHGVGGEVIDWYAEGAW